MKQFFLPAFLLAAAPALAQGAGVEVQNAWARATAPHAEAGGVFLTLTDHGAADRVLGASTPAAATAELHETVEDHGVFRMKPIDALPLAPNASVALKPGGLHVMLFGLKQQLKSGDQFPLSLRFEHAPPVTVTVTVGTAGASGP